MNKIAFRIEGWSEGHPHLTKIEGYPFGYTTPLNPNPILDKSRDGYASSFNQLYRRYERNAAKEKREFKLNREDFYYLTSQPCYYCAAPPTSTVCKRVKRSYLYNGLDRMDCKKGYTLDNVRPCCWLHNDLKGQLSYQEYYRQCLAVVLSESSKTAVDLGDTECLDRLIELFPNVTFLKAHRAAMHTISRLPNEPRFNWLCQPVLPRR